MAGALGDIAPSLQEGRASPESHVDAFLGFLAEGLGEARTRDAEGLPKAAQIIAQLHEPFAGARARLVGHATT